MRMLSYTYTHTHITEERKKEIANLYHIYDLRATNQKNSVFFDIEYDEYRVDDDC